MKPAGLFQSLKDVAALLKHLKVDYSLVGGIAVAFRAIERTTKDIDIAIAVESDGEAEDIVRALQARGYRLFSMLEHQKTGRLATVRFNFPGSNEDMILDILFSSCGIENEIVAAAEMIEVLPRLKMKVASRPYLLAMKVLSMNTTDRIRDMDDARAIIALSSRKELTETKRLLELITTRRCHRNRRLVQRLEKLCAEKPKR